MRQIGELMDDDLRRGSLHGARERRRIEHIDHCRFGPERAQRGNFLG